jgi:hypothetical protein
MFEVDETIEAFRRGALDFDCKRMALIQHKDGGERFEGQGYIRQITDGTLTFKIYVTKSDAKPFGYFDRIKAGKLYTDDALYDLDAIVRDGTCWKATRILPAFHWDASDQSVLVNGKMQLISAHLDMPQPQNCLRLHFFEEYEVPLNLMSEAEKHGNRWMVRDRAEFEACGSKFAVRKRDGLGDTIIEAASENAFPVDFNLRIQEALQYITAKTASWRARLGNEGDNIRLELASPWPKSPRTQFNPPLAPRSYEFYQHGWRLFEKYLAYVIDSNKGTYWHPVAYHLNNACEATAGSLDAWAIGVSVAVEAVASLINIEPDRKEVEQVARVQNRMRELIAEQSDLREFANRIGKLIDTMSNKRVPDTLYALAATGHVDESYITSWTYLRNRHVQPRLKDLKKLDQVDHQQLIDHIHRVEVLLRQLTFYLIK